MHPVVVGIGEVLWDIFPGYARPGGAPANVIYHVSLLGNHGIIASRIGKDEKGESLRQFLTGKQIDTQYLQIDEQHPTGTVEVQMKNDEASYVINTESAWDYLEPEESWLDLAGKIDAVCFGTLAQRSQKSRHTIRKFLDHTTADCLKILDLNLRNPFYNKDIIEDSIRRADVIKLNEEEYRLIGEMFSSGDVENLLFDQYHTQIICLTKGAKGSELITGNAHFVEPRYKVDTGQGDSVGVGDAFTAALTHQMLRQKPLDQALKSANRYAAHIAAKKGAMPEVPELVLTSVFND